MSNPVWKSKDLGPVDAYAEAVAAGYTGTREEWLLEVGSVKENAQAAAGSATAAAGSATEAAGSATSAAASAADALEHTQDVIEDWLDEKFGQITADPPLDRTLSQSNAATPADITGDLKSKLTPKIKEVISDSYTGEAASSTKAAGYSFDSTGTAVGDENADIRRYAVTAGQLVHVKAAKISAGVWYFSDSSTSGPSHVVGGVCQEATDDYFIVPEGAIRVLIAAPKTGSTNTVEIMHYSATESILDTRMLPCEAGGINAGKSTSSGKYVRVKYAFATKGSKLTFAPTTISIYNIAMYFYTSPDENTYKSSETIGYVTAGTSYTYTFQNDTWFRLRASKQDTPDLTDAEIAEISTYFTLETISTNFELPNTNYYLIGKTQAMLAEHQRLLDSFTFPDSWSDKTEEIHKAIGKGFAFGIQTDTHKSLYTKDTGNSTAYAMDANDFTPMKMFTNYVGLDFIANLGDIIRGQGYDTYEEMQESFSEIVYRYVENVACPVLFAVGNHDDAALGTVGGESPTLNEVILPSEQYAIMMKPVINTCYENVAHSKELYYYKDFDDVRVIVLNSRDIDYQAFSQSDIHINHHKIGTEQLAWLSNVALNTDKQVLVLCHVPLVNDLYSTSTFDGRDEAYQALVNFKQNGGTIIGVMCGHTHEANTTEVSGIRNIVFKNGANFAEIVIVDTENKTISTKMVGDYGTLTDRGPFSYT